MKVVSLCGTWEFRDSGRVYLTLSEAGRPLHTTEMHHFVNADDQNRISRSSLQNSIASMAKAGAIIRVERGVYSLPEFADKDYERPRMTISMRLMPVLREAERPLHRREMCQKAEQDGYGPINPKNIDAALTQIMEKGTAVRVQRGFYSLPEFAVKQI